MLTQRKRKIIFLFSLAAFFLLLTPVFFYSLGYRFDANWKLQKSGGIFIKTGESGAMVTARPEKFYLASPFTKSKTTSLLTKSAFIKNVFPGAYTVKVEKNGFWTWQKKLSVQAETVSAREVLLVSTTPEGAVVATNTPLEKSLEALKNTPWHQRIANIPYQKKGNILKPDQNHKPKILFSSVKKFWVLPNEDFLIWGDDRNFYLNDKKTPEFSNDVHAILVNSKNSFFDSAKQRLIFWDTHSINAYWLDDIRKAPLWYTTNPLLHIYSSTEPTSIKKVLEYPGHPNYFLVAMQNGIFAMEEEAAGGSATSADKPNTFPLYKGKSPELLAADARSLLLWDDNNFIELKLP